MATIITRASKGSQLTPAEADANLVNLNNAIAAADARLDSVNTALAGLATTEALAEKQDALGFTPENPAQKNVANGYAGLDGGAKIPAAQLPSYVDDVLEYATPGDFPAIGESGKIYLALDSGQYRWSGSIYALIPSSPGTTDAVLEGSNLYFTAQRVRDAVLTGLSLTTNAAISATDSVLSALGKLQKQVTDNATPGGGVDPTIDPYGFHKLDSNSPAFVKTGPGALSIKAGVSGKVFGVALLFAADTAIVMPALTAGTDYAIYACTDGTIRADASFSVPTGYTTANSRKIGGFHYGLVAAGTTVAGGSFNAAGSPTTGGMVWTQGDVDKIAGINEFSLWDLKFRPACADPRGMVLVNGRTWVDIYLCSTDTAANGTSKAGSNIASGTVLPKIPAAFGGNGTLAYGALNWWVANELARANQKRLMLASEFYDAAFGVTENQSIDATASTYPVTQRNAGYTSRYGIEQATGVHYTWGQDSAGSAAANVANGGRGQSYNNSVFRVILGGARTNGSNSGSRCSNWGNVSSVSLWNFGLRAASDHLQLS